MTGEVDTMAAYVNRRLEHWGEEFALHRDVEWLGYAKKNLLAVLMAHKGMPGRATGFKPIESDPLALQVEMLVTDLARENRPCATVLRAYYCGRGRRTVERYETALMLLANMGDPVISLRQYHTLRKIGDNYVMEALLDIARAA